MISIRTISATALLIAGFGNAAQASAVLAGGHVQDPSGNPLAHVYVRQEGSSASTFTDNRGNFQLLLEPKAGPNLVLSAPDFQPIEVDSSQPIATVTLQRSEVVTVPTRNKPRAASEQDLLTGGFALRYGGKNQSIAYAGNSVSGTIGNALGLSGRARQGNYLWSIDADRSRGAVSIPELTPNNGTTFAPETVETVISLGYVLDAADGELAPYLAGSYRDVHSNSGGVAYTGTPLDWDQTRQSVGFGACYARSIAPYLSGLLDLGYYPSFSTFSTIYRAPYQYANLQGGKLKLELSTSLVPGIRALLGFQHESWGASRYAEDANSVFLGISSKPAEVAL